MIQGSELVNLDSEPAPTDLASEAVYLGVKRHQMNKSLNHQSSILSQSTNISRDLVQSMNSSRDPNLNMGDSGFKSSRDLIETRRDSPRTTMLESIINTEESAQKNATWKPIKSLLGAHQGWVRSLAVDPVTNEWFATGSSDSTIKIWDLVSGDIKATISGHIMAVRSLALSTRYLYLFSGSEDKTVRCWDLERTNSASGCQVRNYHGHVGGVYAMALHPELDLLFTAGRDCVVRVWDMRCRNQIMVLTGHSGDISSLVAQIGDPQICSASMDSTIRLWDLRNATSALTMTHHRKSVRSMVMHPQETTLASADSTGTINEWVLPSGDLLDSFGARDPDKTNIINTLAVNPASNELFAGFSDGRIQFYDYQTGQLSHQTSSTPAPGSETSSIYTSAFDMLGLRLITGESDKSIKIWGR